MIRARSALIRAFALACLLVLASCRGCIGCGDPVGLDPDAFFQIVVLHVFAAFHVLVSLVGSSIAVVRMAQRRRRSFINIVIAVPFALMAIALHANATDGFTRIDDQTFIRAWRLLPAHLSMGWLLGFLGAPLVWLSVAIVEAALAPQQPRARRREGDSAAEPPIPPLTVDRAVVVVMPLVLVLAAYTSIFVIAAHRGPPASLPGPTALPTATSAASSSP